MTAIRKAVLLSGRERIEMEPLMTSSANPISGQRGRRRGGGVETTRWPESARLLWHHDGSNWRMCDASPPPSVVGLGHQQMRCFRSARENIRGSGQGGRSRRRRRGGGGSHDGDRGGRVREFGVVPDRVAAAGRGR